jgi:hypothetical protein
MKKKLQKLFMFGAIALASFNAKAQTVATFENLTLTTNSYFDGASHPFGTTFNSGNVIFKNKYDTAYGGYWTGGWAYSNVKDSTTVGYSNLHAARVGTGYANSANYVVGQQNARVILKGQSLGQVVSGMYVTNGTYAALSMKNGDAYGKKFGSTNNAKGSPDGTNGADWFKITARKYYGGVKTADTAVFYLADFRFTDNTKDYIVNNWRWMDLSILGKADSLEFSLSSSDNGQFGMNTPAFFCADNLTTFGILAGISTLNNSASIAVFPNPATDNLNIGIKGVETNGLVVQIYDALVKMVYTDQLSKAETQVSVVDLPAGIYHLNIVGASVSTSKTFIKQ